MTRRASALCRRDWLRSPDRRATIGAPKTLQPKRWHRRRQTIMPLAPVRSSRWPRVKGFLAGMDQGRALAEAAIDEVRLAGEAVTPRKRASILCSLGQICWWHGDPEASVRYCKAALDAAGQAAPAQLSPTAAEAHIIMATPYLYWRDLETALSCAERGLEIAQSLQIKELLPSAYAVLGNVLTRRGEMARAESCLRQSVELAQGLGLETYAQVMATGFLAFNLHQQGRSDEARQLAESALWSRAANPHTYEMYVCRSVLADILLESGQLDQAEMLFMSLLEVGQRRQFRIPLGMVHFGLAYIALEQGRRPRRHRDGEAVTRSAGTDRRARSSISIREEWPMSSAGHCWRPAFTAHGSPRRLRNQGANRSNLVAVQPDRTTVRIQSLGEFRVFVDEAEVTQARWVSAKARELLAYFVTYRHERITVDRVLDEVWAGRAGRGKTAFHTALSRLRNALRGEGQSTKFILVEDGRYWFDTARFQVDVNDFDALLAKARVAPPEQAAHFYAQALDLYRGEYLSSYPYTDWATPERRRLAEAYLFTLRSLAAHRSAGGDLEGAYELLCRSLVIDPLHEESHCTAMRCLAAQGDRAGVNRQYQQLVTLLDDELGVPPLPSTQQLVEQLLQ